MCKQQSGTRSTFGQQVLSQRPSSPNLKFGSGSRTRKTYDKETEAFMLGVHSPGPSYELPSGLGLQHMSRCTTAPACTISQRPSSAQMWERSSRTPGPGHYEAAYETIGEQAKLSQQPTSAGYRIGRADRWCEFKEALSGPSALQPLLNQSRPPSGYLGDAPAWSFYGRGGRVDLTGGATGLTPSSVQSPGPGSYNKSNVQRELLPVSHINLHNGSNWLACGMLLPQVDGRFCSPPATRIGSAKRDNVMKQYLSHEQERMLLGRTSPGPNAPATSSIGRQLTSRQRNASGFKFGTSDRFSDMKPRPESRGRNSVVTMGPQVPGPGAYVI
eukprot:jgi/Chrzof1/7129/Cz02g12060.t1